MLFLAQPVWCTCPFFFSRSISTVVKHLQKSRNEQDGLFSDDSAEINLWGFYLEEIQDNLFDGPQKRSEAKKDMGLVFSVADGIVKSLFLDNVMAGELVEFWGKNNALICTGLVMSLEVEFVSILLFGQDRSILPGNIIRRTFALAKLLVNESLLGLIIDSLGNRLDGSLRPIVDTFGQYRQIDVKAPGIMPRSKVVQPLNTGILLIDSLIPIGLGQRELIIGDRQIGKTALAVDIIVNQAWMQTVSGRQLWKILGVICIYVAIGQKRSSVIQICNSLIKYSAFHNACIVAATASDAASLQFLAPYAGCAVGEYFRDSGLHALVVYDDLSKHAVAYRQISLLLRRSPGREAYPGDIFYLHSRLLERAAKMSMVFGGGSLTALPIVETLSGDVSAYIPTNVISITDGQIFLEKELFYKGFRPAVNIGLSVSRIGAAAQIPALRAVANSLKLELAQFREVETFLTFGADDIDKITRKILYRGLRLIEILKQPQFSPLLAIQQVILIYSGISGFLDKLSLVQVRKFKRLITANVKVSGGVNTNSVELLTLDVTKKIKNEVLTDIVLVFLKWL